MTRYVSRESRLKRKQICLFYLVMCFVSLFLMVKATDAMLSQQSGISEMSRQIKNMLLKLFSVKSLGFLLTMQKILKQH